MRADPRLGELPRAPFALGRRGLVLSAITLVGLGSYLALGLSPSGLAPRRGGLEMLGDFLSSALHPAWSHEGSNAAPGARPVWLEALGAVRSTLVFAAAGTSLALVIGLVLGFLGATSWWADERASSRTRFGAFLRSTARPLAWGGVRALIVAMRSVHELLWAVLFLAAFGLTPLGAVLAIAIPYGGTLAKVFSEMLDECPRESARGLRAIGAGPLAVFSVGLLPRALPDLAAYAFYRFECAVRSSAVLGFFGYPTLGYFIRLSTQNLHYREVWTYLYALIATCALIELWSGALRRRLVVR